MTAEGEDIEQDKGTCFDILTRLERKSPVWSPVHHDSNRSSANAVKSTSSTYGYDLLSQMTRHKLSGLLRLT
jgi:hypothetical protein